MAEEIGTAEDKEKALAIVRAAFENCEQQDISGIVAIGAFLDHIIGHLVSMNDRQRTAEFLESLGGKVREGVYDPISDN